MLESLFNKFADIKSEILLDERLHHGYFSMKKFYLKNTFSTAEAVVRRCSKKQVILEISQNLQENTCTSGLLLYWKRLSLTQVFSCEFCEISQNTFFVQNTSGGCFCNRTSPDDCFWYLKNLTFKLSILTIQF